MTTIDPELASYFEKAADYIFVHGHCKGAFEAPDGSVCALGALRRVTGYADKYAETNAQLFADRRVPVRNREIELLLSTTSDVLWDHLGGSVPDWNDNNDADTVIDTLRRLGKVE